MTKLGGFLHNLSKKYILDTRLMRPETERVESLIMARGYPSYGRSALWTFYVFCIKYRNH